MPEIENDLRDALNSAFEQHSELQSAETAAPVSQEPAPAETSTRSRDDAGRFTKSEKQAEVKSDAAPAVQAAPAAPEVSVRKAPDSWKKEMWDAYGKLDPTVADYIQERERQFASGVSTYKQEADKAKEIYEAIAPFQQDLQAHNLSASTWIRQLGGAHQILVRGTPEQKIQAFQHLAQSYGVPMQNIASGQVDPLMQYLSPLQQKIAQLEGSLTGFQEQQRNQEQQALSSEIQRFAQDHEHFEAVKEQMAGLLQAGVAKDLNEAYSKAVRLNDDIFASDQQRKQEDAEKQRRDQEAQRVAKAKSNVISIKGATPTSSGQGKGNKDLRPTLSAAFDEYSSPGRI